MTVIGGPLTSRRRPGRRWASWLYRACRRRARCSSTQILCVHRMVIYVRHRTDRAALPDITRRHTVYCFRSIAGTLPVIRPKARGQSRGVPAATDLSPPPTSATATALGRTLPTSIDRRRCRRCRWTAAVQRDRRPFRRSRCCRRTTWNWRRRGGSRLRRRRQRQRHANSRRRRRYTPPTTLTRRRERDITPARSSHCSWLSPYRTTTTTTMTPVMMLASWRRLSEWSATPSAATSSNESTTLTSAALI